MSESEHDKPHQAVRFTSENETIAPESSLEQVENLTSPPKRESRDDLTEQAQEELKNLSITLQKSRLQTKRMEHFAYDPVSLPPSRVPSGSSQNVHHSRPPSPKSSPPASNAPTPPLTPSGSGSREAKANIDHSRLRAEPTPVTPQISPPHDGPPASAAAQARLPQSSQPRPRSMVEMSGAVPAHPKQASIQQVVGPTGDSPAASQEPSPSGTPGTQTPYSRPYTPQGSDQTAAFARSGKLPQGRIPDTAEARYIFGSRDKPQTQYIPSSSQPPRSNGTGAVVKPENKRHTFLSANDKHEKHNSMSDLKRFFKIGGHHKKEKRDKSPAPSRETGTQTPPSRGSAVSLPFAEDHGLESKYGKFGKVLGSGAGGSVRIMKRASDGTTFAVKQFRDRHSYESEKEYSKKVTAEFCIGSTLHHGNIIETMDIVHEKGKWYEVMEYAPYDLFAIVMTGKMSREEVACSTLQILAGVTYLHSMGLAHRDLKLDNVVVNEYGIMKLIDFGSAAVFRYPFENEIVLASGIVGSDPYLAPEVYDLPKYDPQPTDVWSLAIIFCCMTLRRFPWKAPRVSDSSYRLFVSQPTEEERRQSGVYPQSEPASRRVSENDDPRSVHHHHHSHHAKSHEPTQSAPATRNNPNQSSDSISQTSQAPVIKGPWRLLRLLPRETRHIVGCMLEVDPKKRATLEDVHADPWVQRNLICRQEEGGKVINAQGHIHTLEHGNDASEPTSKK